MGAVAGKTPPEPIPLTVLTGFLGAGKTTLLNRLLRDPALAETAVLVNEVGEIGIDHLLYEIVDENVMLLSSGCLCCSMRGDLVDALENLLRARDNGRLTPFRRVIIETTGLADPASVLHVTMTHPYLTLRYRLDGVVTAVDAINGEATLDRHPESVKQAAVADRIVLTKSDLAPDTEAIRARLRRLNPAARILDAARGEATPENLLGAGLYDPSRKIPDVSRWLADAAVNEAETHGHAHDHDHVQGHNHAHDNAHGQEHTLVHAHPHRHDERIRVFSLATDAPMPLATLELFLDLLRSAHGPNFLRLKGIVRLAEDPDRPVVLHMVQHVVHPPARLEAWPDDDRRTRLVCVTDGLEPAKVRGMFDAFLGLPRPDTPDRAALVENPLALNR